MENKKVLFVAVFDNEGKSTNNSQIRELKKLCECQPFNYRVVASEIGEAKRDEALLREVKHGNFDLVIFAKCNGISNKIIKEISNHTKTCLWFMDPLTTYYNNEFIEKTKLCTYFVCDKENVLTVARKINGNSKRICEGFDQEVDIPYDLDKKYNASFIGNIYGNRKDIIEKISEKIFLISNAYSSDHAKAVSMSKINLNFCTSDGASDRVYKIMASGGFLLTDDWRGRSEYFEDGKDLVIFETYEDLNKKIDFYVNNKDAREEIAKQGMITVQKFSRHEWAKNILNFCLY